jgi:hypothetical protein
LAKRGRNQNSSDPERPKRATDYAQVLARVFDKHKVPGASEFPFPRSALLEAASEVGVSLPKNIGDVVYSHRYRTDAPDAIAMHEPEGKEWVVFGAGKSKYRFVLVKKVRITANAALKPIKIPDATPEIIREYALNDEQALLAKIRYNRLIDLFLGVVAYPLQSHLRTSVKEIGQIEIDELYVGVNRRGAHFVVPVQAKTANDRVGIVQVWQDMQLCRAHDKFKHMVARPVGAQVFEDAEGNEVIALFELQVDGYDLALVEEMQYRLVPWNTIEKAELDEYRATEHRDSGRVG